MTMAGGRATTANRTPRANAWFLVVPLAAAAAAVVWLVFLAFSGRGPGAGGVLDEAQASSEEAPEEASGGEAGLKGSEPLKPKAGGMEAEEVPEKPTFPKSEGVWGRVVDANEKPIPGAKVALFQVDPLNPWARKDGTLLAAADVAADGTYLVGPAPLARMKIRAEAPGWASDVKPVVTRGARVDLILDRAGALKVRTTNRKGEPIKGAEVTATAQYGWYSGASGARSVRTGEGGEAIVDGLAPGPVDVRVSAPGFGAANLTQVLVQPAKTVERSIVLGPAMAIAGRVVDDQREAPIEGAEVWAKLGWDPDAPKSDVAKTDADGRFRIEAAGGGGEQLLLTARKEGYADGSQWLQMQAGAQAPQEVSIKLGKGGEAKGNVLDADGRSVAGARVVYLNQGWGSPAMALSATTDAEGQFSLPLPPGTGKGWNLQVGATAAGKGIGMAQVMESQPRGATIKLLGVGTVSGKVVAAGGGPLEGAAVTLMYDWSSRGGGGVPQETQNWMYRQMLGDTRVVNLAATTDLEGAFRLDDVPVGAYRVDATWGLERGAASETVTVRSGSSETVRLEVTSGSVIEGKVLDRDGNPIYGAFVNAWDPQNRNRQQMQATYARSQADGRFVLRSVVGGPWTISANAAGFGAKQVQGIQVGDRNVELKLAPLGWIEGVVTVDGQPFTGAFTVSIQSTAREDGRSRDEWAWRSSRGGGWDFGGGREETFTSADGTFVLRGVPAGPWKVNVSTQDDWIPSATPEVSVTDGRGAGPVDVRLSRGASVSGAVLEEATRGPIPNSTVNLRLRGQATSGGTTWAWMQTDARGRFSGQGLASGTYVLSVTTATGMQWEEEVRLEAGQRTEKDLLVPKWGSARIRVVDHEGNPVANANISLMTERGSWIQPNWDLLRKEGLVDWSQPNAWQAVMSTDATGTNVRYHVPPGRIQVQVGIREGGKRPPPPQWIVVESDRTTDITISLPAPPEQPGGDGK